MINPKTFELKDGRKIVVREALETDAAALNSIVLSIISSTPFALTTPSELDLSVNAQKERIREFRQEEGFLILVAEWQHKFVGTLDFKNNDKLRIRHWGEFGMGLHPDFRSLGLGRFLLQQLLDWAAANPVIEKVCLGVYAENKIALHLYRDFGFIEEGRLIKAIKTAPGVYADEVRMYKFV